MTKALYVDDDTGQLKSMADLARCEVVTCAFFDDAAHALTEITFDVVISDFDLRDTGGRTGEDVLALARELQPDARRIMLSGLPRTTEHADRFLLKGFEGLRALLDEELV